MPRHGDSSGGLRIPRPHPDRARGPSGWPWYWKAGVVLVVIWAIGRFDTPAPPAAPAPTPTQQTCVVPTKPEPIVGSGFTRFASPTSGPPSTRPTTTPPG